MTLSKRSRTCVVVGTRGRIHVRVWASRGAPGRDSRATLYWNNPSRKWVRQLN
jgi:hypothetical protein